MPKHVDQTFDILETCNESPRILDKLKVKGPYVAYEQDFCNQKIAKAWDRVT